MEKPSAKPLTGLRKRQQIDATNKHIFIWLAVSSVIISFCIVALQFLIKEFMFNQKVINQKSETNQRLMDNVVAGKELTKNINNLLADTNLESVKKEDPTNKTSTLNVIFDALPTKGDATSFANSLQTVVLPLSGVGIRELSTTTDPAGLETEGVTTGTGPSEPQSLPFKASFNGTYADVQKALVDIARVIRPISPTELSIRSEDNNKLLVTLSGLTYYLPARAVEVKTEVLRP